MNYEIAEQIPLYGGISDPCRIGNGEYVFVAPGGRRQIYVVYAHRPDMLIQERAFEVAGCLVWSRDRHSVFLVRVPDALTGAQRQWVSALFQSARDVDALQAIIAALNEAPLPWPGA